MPWLKATFDGNAMLVLSVVGVPQSWQKF